MRAAPSLTALLLCAALPCVLAAQEDPLDLSPGDRIEIDAPTLDARLVPATVTHSDSTWIEFSLEDGQVWTRHLYQVDEIRVRREVPLGSRVRTGAAWGVFLGTSLGGISGPFVARAIEGETDAWAAVGASAGAGALTGAAVGALVNALLPRTAWRHYVFRAPRRP